MRELMLLGFVFCFTASLAAQSRRSYNGFYIDLNRDNRAVAIRFSEGDGAGCSEISSANATLIDVTWNIVPTKFMARFKSGKKSFFVPDSIGNISNVERGLLADIFDDKKRVSITWRECGSGNIPDLIGIRTLDSVRSPSLTPRSGSSGSSTSGQNLLTARGFFCGQSEPGWVNVHLQVGNSVRVFSTSPDGGIRKKGFSKPFFQLPIGTELIIKYKVAESYGARGNWIYEAIATGRRNRSVRGCVSD